MAEPVKPFRSDGCSGGMSWAWRRIFDVAPPWEADCFAHDWDYWRGGTWVERVQSDARLVRNMTRRGFDRSVAAGVGYAILSVGMAVVIRPGGSPWLPTPWRWGYGHRWPRYA